jgi:hypothetical protein
VDPMLAALTTGIKGFKPLDPMLQGGGAVFDVDWELPDTPTRICELDGAADGWMECYDPSQGRCYYYHQATDKSQWAHPHPQKDDVAINRSSTKSGQAALPPPLLRRVAVTEAVPTKNGGGGPREGAAGAAKVWKQTVDANAPFRQKRFLFQWHLWRTRPPPSEEEAALFQSGDAAIPGMLSIQVQRVPPHQFLTDSVLAIHPDSVSEMELRLRPRVVFAGEPGIDAGGLTKDWLLLFSRSLLNPDLCLFKV